MFKLFDICFLKDARRYDLEMPAVLVTSQGVWLFAFGRNRDFVFKMIYKTLIEDIFSGRTKERAGHDRTLEVLFK